MDRRVVQGNSDVCVVLAVELDVLVVKVVVVVDTILAVLVKLVLVEQLLVLVVVAAVLVTLVASIVGAILIVSNHNDGVIISWTCLVLLLFSIHQEKNSAEAGLSAVIASNPVMVTPADCKVDASLTDQLATLHLNHAEQLSSPTRESTYISICTTYIHTYINMKVSSSSSGGPGKLSNAMMGRITRGTRGGNSRSFDPDDGDGVSQYFMRFHTYIHTYSTFLLTSTYYTRNTLYTCHKNT